MARPVDEYLDEFNYLFMMVQLDMYGAHVRCGECGNRWCGCCVIMDGNVKVSSCVVSPLCPSARAGAIQARWWRALRHVASARSCNALRWWRPVNCPEVNRHQQICGCRLRT